jgi:hypothetical protein
MFVKPAAGLKIRDPFKKDHLPAEGREVPDSDLYWHRLLRDGDVVAASPAPEPATEAAPKAKSINLPTEDRSAQ